MPFDPFAFERRDVGGVPVFARKLPWVSGHAAVRVAFRVGGRVDPAGKEGLAHFFEHLPFDGCEGAPTHEAIDNVGETLFMGTLNAWTGLDFTSFFGRVRAARVGEALDFFRRLIWHPLLAPAEVERERQVITREIWRRYGTPKDLELAKLRWADALPVGHRFAAHHCSLGFPETVAAVTRDELLAFHREAYVRENGAVFLVGDVDLDALAPALESFVAGIPSGAALPRPAVLAAPVVPPNPLRELSYGEFFGVVGDSRPKDTELEWERNVPAGFAPDRALLLAAGVARRVAYDEVRGKFGATYAVSGYAHFYPDFANVGLFTKTDPERADEIRAHVEATVRRLAAADPAFAGKFDEVKGAALDRLETAERATMDVAEAGEDDWARTGTTVTLASEIADLRAATYASTAELVRRALLPDDCHRFVMRP